MFKIFAKYLLKFLIFVKYFLGYFVAVVPQAQRVMRTTLTCPILKNHL